jgi:CarS bacterial SH3 domain
MRSFRDERATIRIDVRGAPFRIGETVSIIGSKDKTFDSRYRDRLGTVRYLEYACGCGQTYPRDPMIGVEFRGGKVEEFWREELRPFRNQVRQKKGARATVERGR